MLLVRLPLLCILLLAIIPTGNAQNFNEALYIDSAANFGYSVFREADTSFLVLGEKSFGMSGIMSARVSSAGNAILSANYFGLDSSRTGIGGAGRAKLLPSGDYLAPFTIVWRKRHSGAATSGYA